MFPLCTAMVRRRRGSRQEQRDDTCRDVPGSSGCHLPSYVVLILALVLICHMSFSDAGEGEGSAAAASAGPTYTENFPLPQNYKIYIFMDPCRSNAYNCCMNVFGEAEYPLTRLAKNEIERSVPVDLLASDTEVKQNYDLVYEDGSSVLSAQSVTADDDSILDYSCVRFRKPHLWCAGKNFAFTRSSYRPPCADNNASLNALASCPDPLTGDAHEKCAQVAYTQNAFIAQCGVKDPECGTFLEIHQRQGTPYSSETDVISSVQIDQFNVSGAYTTMLNLTWMGEADKVLCAYSESEIRVGSVVYILPTSPQCCCPDQYDFVHQRTFVGVAAPGFGVLPTYAGAFWCPWGPGGTSGPYASYDKSVYDALVVDSNVVKYPFCHGGQEEPDVLMCSVQDPASARFYTRECAAVNYTTGSASDIAQFHNDPAKAKNPYRFSGCTAQDPCYTSIDLAGLYRPPMSAIGGIPETGACPFTPSCARIGGFNSSLSSGCVRPDKPFNFIGRVGVVVEIDNLATVPQVWVTFNGGRTKYQFDQRWVEFNRPQRSQYEIWWVVRTKGGGRVVQKRKGFNVTEPQCTFDKQYNRYFPYAMLDDMGMPIDSTHYDGPVNYG